MLSTKGGVGKTTLAASLDGPDITLSDDPEGAIQRRLAIRADGMLQLSRALASPIMSDDNYDVVIIDTQGAASHLQNNAALAASQIIWSPARQSKAGLNRSGDPKAKIIDGKGRITAKAIQATAHSGPGNVFRPIQSTKMTTLTGTLSTPGT
ncbi:hypothetical protein [Cupriavidus sp. CuC1]|uniref:hypothetical protein n=1 Tax=Cupriavidus sp. CuC1 TaxID=3373131 RepID=UPI0037D35D48